MDNKSKNRIKKKNNSSTENNKLPFSDLPKIPPAQNLFEKYFSGKKGLWACSLLLVLICFFVFKEYILLNNVYLFKDVASDSLNASYAQFLNISDYLRTQGFPKWSFNNGVGQNIFALILRDPTDIIAYAFGNDQIPYVIIFKELSKIIVSGLVFFLYLRKLSLTTYTSIIGALLYSFTGFMILGSGWYIFTFEAMILALLLFSFEKILQDKSWYLFPFLIALIGISMPFNLFVYGLFLLVYILFRYILERGMELKGLFKLMLQMALLTILGLGISSVFLFSNIKQLLESPRVGGDTTYFDSLSQLPLFGFAEPLNYVTTIMRSFSSDILGVGLKYRGWSNYLEAPLFYCGLLTLLLIPQVFNFLNKKQKIVYSIFIAIWIIPIIFPFFRYTFWLFTGDYYRAFSLCIDTVFIFVGLHALNFIDRSGKVNRITLLATLLLLLILLFYPYLQQTSLVDKQIRGAVRNFLIVYSILLYFHGVPKVKLVMQIALILTLFIELTYFSSVTVNKRTVISSKELKQKTGFNDYTNEAISYINKTDKSFFRIDKIYSSSPAYNGGLNDPQVQNYKGTSTYNSFNQKYYVQFLNALNVTNVQKDKAELESRRISGLINRPLLQSLFSVKYVLSKFPNNNPLYGGNDSITQFGDVKIFKNKNNLPLGFTYDKYIASTDFLKLPNLQKDILLFDAFVIDDIDKDRYKDFTRFDLKDTASGYSWEAYAKDIKELKQDTLAIVENNHNTIKGNITIDKKKLLFFSIPFDTGWNANVDGKEAKVELVDFGLMGLNLDKGQHTVELNYIVPYLNTGIIVSGISLLTFLLIIVLEKMQKKKAQIVVTNN